MMTIYSLCGYIGGKVRPTKELCKDGIMAHREDLRCFLPKNDTNSFVLYFNVLSQK